jgi:hypothetical protein
VGAAVKAAETVVETPTVTVQLVPLEELQPVHPEKVEPEAAAAVSVTEVPWGSCALQVAPQEIDEPVTVPVPVPVLVTLSVPIGTGLTLKVAVTDCAVDIVTTQVAPLVEPQPDQLENVEPIDAVAVNVTTVPGANEALQVGPQAMPLGLLTVPVPAPSLVTVSG